MYLENKLKTLETRPDFIDNPEYTETNEKLDKIYQEKISFLSLEKSRVVQNQIRNILIGNIEVNNQKDINNELYLYYKNLFNERQHLSEHDINYFLKEFLNFLNYLLNNL